MGRLLIPISPGSKALATKPPREPSGRSELLAAKSALQEAGKALESERRQATSPEKNVNRLKEQVRKLRVGLQDLQDKRQHADIQLALFENDGGADRAEAPLNTGQSTYRSYSWITLTQAAASIRFPFFGPFRENLSTQYLVKDS
eukprot:scaffold1666_cov203-Pinguiococcus_pyrenoidosus.AAC.1